MTWVILHFMDHTKTLVLCICLLASSLAHGQSLPNFEDVLKKVERGPAPPLAPLGTKTEKPSALRPIRAVQVFSGIYELELVAPKDRQPARFLVLGSGERLVLGYGIQPEEFQYVDRSVVVRGKRFQALPGEYPLTQGHIQVSQIGLAPGEKPNPKANRSLPVPDAVKTIDGVLGRLGRWAHILGELVSVTSDPRTLAHRAKFKLQDGTLLQVDYLSSEEAKAWFQLVGKPARLLGTPRMGRPMRVDKPAALCPSNHPVCTQL